MDKLLAYLNSLNVESQEAFALRCKTTLGYLRKAGSIKQRLGDGLCLRISIESAGAIRPEDLRPDMDWSYLRAGLANSSPVATNSEAQGA